MTGELKEAANDLYLSMRGFPWFQAVGVGLIDEVLGLMVYVTYEDPFLTHHIPSVWAGFRVSYRVVGNILPATTALLRLSALYCIR